MWIKKILKYCIQFLLHCNTSLTVWLKLQSLSTYILLLPWALSRVSKEMAFEVPTAESKRRLASVLNASPDGCPAAVAVGLWALSLFSQHNKAYLSLCLLLIISCFPLKATPGSYLNPATLKSWLCPQGLVENLELWCTVDKTGWDPTFSTGSLQHVSVSLGFPMSLHHIALHYGLVVLSCVCQWFDPCGRQSWRWEVVHWLAVESALL